MRHPRPILVFGPAYLDRVVRVDGPLLDPALGLPPVDRSVDGAWLCPNDPADRLDLVDPTGATLAIGLPDSWDGPAGTIRLARPLGAVGRHSIRALSGSSDLGGMGAGFAALLGGTLISALGPADDPTSQAVVALMERHRIAHQPVRIAGREADWTLLVSSGPHGDKLAIGFRGCHAAWTELPPEPGPPARVRVAAALPNALAPAALGDRGNTSSVRAFFPNARAMLDREHPVAGFADRIDFLSCNRGEWLDMGDRAGALDRVPLVAVTDGAAGASIRLVDPAGKTRSLRIRAFPRLGPIRDTNRAGEAFAGTLLARLIEVGPDPEETRVWLDAERAAAAAALVLGREGFGFATAEEIDEALRLGVAPDLWPD